MADSQNDQALAPAVDARSMALAGILQACEQALDSGNVSHDELLASMRSALRILGRDSTPRVHRPRPPDDTSAPGQELRARPGQVDQLTPLVAVDVDALGELLSNLARLCHKINNPLTSVMGRAQMMQMRLEKQGSVDEASKKSVAVIEESAKRVAGLVQEMANLVCHGRKEFVEHCDYDSNAG